MEHPSRIVKCQFGFKKVYYRGIDKNDLKPKLQFTLANLWMARRRKPDPALDGGLACLVNRKEAENKEEIRIKRSPQDFSNLDVRNEGSKSAQSHLINEMETDSIDLSRLDQTFLYFLRLHVVVMVRAMLVRIGNSRGIGLAKALLEIAGLVNEVDIAAAPGVLTIRPSVHLMAC